MENGKCGLKILSNQAGYSLMQMTIMLAVMGTMASATVNMMSSLNKQQRLVQETYDINDLKTRLSLTLQNSATCDCQFQNKVLPTNQNRKITLNKLTEDCSANSMVLAQTGHAIDQAGRLVIESIEVDDFTPVNSSVSLARVSVNFETAEGSPHRRPVRLVKAFNVTPTVIDSCTDKVTSGGSIPNCQQGEIIVVGANGIKECKPATKLLSDLNCPDGETVAFVNGEMTCSGVTIQASQQQAQSPTGCSATTKQYDLFYGCGLMGSQQITSYSLPTGGPGQLVNKSCGSGYTGTVTYQCNAGSWQCLSGSCSHSQSW